jgi:hypothetical protein
MAFGRRVGRWYAGTAVALTHYARASANALVKLGADLDAWNRAKHATANAPTATNVAVGGYCFHNRRSKPPNTSTQGGELAPTSFRLGD